MFLRSISITDFGPVPQKSALRKRIKMHIHSFAPYPIQCRRITDRDNTFGAEVYERAKSVLTVEGHRKKSS
jgi:hypothetical protein